jgi:SET domain-containing protein
MMLPSLFVATSGKKGRGVFTSKAIPAKTVVEISPVLVLSAKERKTIEETKLYHYVFEWGDSKRMAALALGYISMYNHDYSSNCEYEMDFDENIMTIRTVRPIKKGEELSINYNADPNDKTLVWFHQK